MAERVGMEWWLFDGTHYNEKRYPSKFYVVSVVNVIFMRRHGFNGQEKKCSLKGRNPFLYKVCFACYITFPLNVSFKKHSQLLWYLGCLSCFREELFIIFIQDLDFFWSLLWGLIASIGLNCKWSCTDRGWVSIFPIAHLLSKRDYHTGSQRDLRLFNLTSIQTGRSYKRCLLLSETT